MKGIGERVCEKMQDKANTDTETETDKQRESA